MRRFSIAILSAALVWAAWQIVAKTAAHNLASSQPSKALAWNHNDAEALDRFGREKLTAGDAGQATQLAVQSLLANPLDVAALSLLGQAAESQRQEARATALMELAGERTKNDLLTQAWIFDRNFRRGQYARALPHIDAVLRAYAYEPDKMWSQFLPTLAGFTVNDRSIDALVRFLATKPIWRGWLLGNLSIALVNRDQLVKVYDALAKSSAPATTEELNSYLNRLIKDGRFAEAYGVWRQTLTPQQQSEAGLLYNGDFAAPINGLSFNWVFASAAGADIQVVHAPDSQQGNALRIDFSGARVNFANVYRLLLLKPGNYRLSGQVKAADLRTSRGLWWHIYCANAANSDLAQTQLVSRSTPWTGFSVEFSVPESGCEAQWLRLENPARIPPEREIAGEVWYRELQISAQ